MTKDIFGNEITHDILGNRLKRNNKREPVPNLKKMKFSQDKRISAIYAKSFLI